jgi:membrane protease YdiL (CAAX protease family)
MLGIIVALAISWLLLFIIEKKDLRSLGFLPIAKKLKLFINGFLITAVLCAMVQYSESLITSSTWVINEKVTSQIILNAFWWDLKSVLTEELVFRGALLYILMQKVGSSKGILISAIAFGIYHWFSFGLLGNKVAMILVFFGTGLMGYAWAWAFSKTKSIMLPFGFHLGWNFIHNTIFSKGPLGELVLTSQGGNQLSDSISLLKFILGLVLVPILLLIYVRYFVKEKTLKKVIIE